MQTSSGIETGVKVRAYHVSLEQAGEEQIKELAASGKIVICHFNAGAISEKSDDFDSIDVDAIGSSHVNRDDLFWMDYRSDDVIEYIDSMLLKAKDSDCSGVAPWYLDGFDGDSGFSLTKQSQSEFNQAIVEKAHRHRLTVGWVNGASLVSQMVDYFDWALVEECSQFAECSQYKKFIDAGKAVFQVEYGPVDTLVCEKTKPK